MSDTFSFTQAEMDAAKAAGFESPEQQRRQAERDAAVASARARGDDCEARIFAGAAKAEDYTIEQRRERSRIETMFSGSGLTPWHRLPEAKVLPETATSIEALDAAGLNWRVTVEPVIVEREELRGNGAVPARAIVRETDRKVLGAGGRRYTAVQNETLFAIGDALVGAGAKWETAGAMDGGRRVWALMKFNGAAEEIAPGDRVETYLCLANSHDGTRAAEVFLTTVRIVCNNSFRIGSTAARADGLSFRFHHTENVEDRLLAAGEILKAAMEQREKFVETARAMALTPFASADQLRFLATALGIPETLDADGKATPQAMAKLERAKGALALERETAAAGAADTVWTAFNAVTRMTTHDEKLTRGGDEKRLAATVWGEGAAIANRAWGAAEALAEQAASGGSLLASMLN